MMEGRRYSDGLHQALEAKEGVEDADRESDARLYHLPELFSPLPETGRHDGHGHDRGCRIRRDLQSRSRRHADEHADDSAGRRRRDLPDTNREAQRDPRTIAECHERGQPVLVGTVSIEKSEELSALLKKRKMKHEVLNARHHEREAHIIADAGMPGAVITIATNMAGRGTDIQLRRQPRNASLARARRRRRMKLRSNAGRRKSPPISRRNGES